MQAHQNAEHHQHNAGQPAIVEEEDGGIDFEDKVGREDERRGHQHDF